MKHAAACRGSSFLPHSNKGDQRLFCCSSIWPTTIPVAQSRMLSQSTLVGQHAGLIKDGCLNAPASSMSAMSHLLLHYVCNACIGQHQFCTWRQHQQGSQQWLLTSDCSMSSARLQLGADMAPWGSSKMQSESRRQTQDRWSVADLKADVFALPVAIQPQDQDVASLRLILQMAADMRLHWQHACFWSSFSGTSTCSVQGPSQTYNKDCSRHAPCMLVQGFLTGSPYLLCIGACNVWPSRTRIEDCSC